MAQLLGNVTVGSIVKLNENGSPIDYLVVHQGKPSSSYDSSCDGTWLLRQDIAENRAWDSGNSNVLESSDIHSYLNNTWINRYDTDIRNAIKQVKIPYRQNGGSGGTDRNGANGLSCKIFLLSGKEVGWDSSDNQYFPNDGAKLSYFLDGTSSSANQKRVATLNGSATIWWLRSPSTNNTYYVWVVNSGGHYYNWDVDNSYGVRPALILPTNLVVHDDGFIFDFSAPTLTAPTTAVQTQSISLSWSSVSGATSYQLQRNTGSSWETIYTGPNTSYEDTAGNWSSVQYQVCAFVNTLYGAYSDPQTVTILPPSAVPTINSISTVNLTESFTITWNSAANADSYVLQRNIGSGWEEVYSGANLQYQDQALYSNMSYRVASVITDLYQSAWSPEYTVDINGQMIEMNIKNDDGSYETIYPKTLIGNVVGIEDQYYTKQESLQSNVATLIGLTNQAVPNDMFNILAHAGDLHVWKRTQSGAIDYPISVNKNAYQEGSDGQPAGYTLGEVQSGQFSITNKNYQQNGDVIGWRIFNTLNVDENGTIQLIGWTDATAVSGNSGYLENAKKLIGKYAYTVNENTHFAKEVMYYFPADATVSLYSSEGWQYQRIEITKYQTVTGYPAIPANTTIEYMGQIGDKVGAEMGSYVGNGQYGVSNPVSLTFSRLPKIVFVQQKDIRHGYTTAIFCRNIPIIAYVDSSGQPTKNSTSASAVGIGVNWSGNTLSYYHTVSSVFQLNSAGYTYQYVAIL